MDPVLNLARVDHLLQLLPDHHIFGVDIVQPCTQMLLTFIESQLSQCEFVAAQVLVNLKRKSHDVFSDRLQPTVFFRGFILCALFHYRTIYCGGTELPVGVQLY
jgi:hypothetical protein